MKYIKIITVIVFIISFTGCSNKRTKEVKVMTWNIWHGGLHGSKANNFEEDTINTNNVLKVLLQESPDIVFMQETYCCGMDVAKQAGYTYSWRGSTNLSIHSKYPIIDTLEIYKPFNSHGVIIDVEGTKILTVNLWLHYLPDVFVDMKTYSPDSLIAGEGTTRLKEITAILNDVKILEDRYKMPVIMGGDFNSGSHLDWVESTKEAHYGKVVEWPVSKLMKNQNYVDSFREVHLDPTKTLEGTWGYLNEDLISDRIDFIYYKGNRIKTKSSKIVMEDPIGGFFNSDHRAILSTFELIE